MSKSVILRTVVITFTCVPFPVIIRHTFVCEMNAIAMSYQGKFFYCALPAVFFNVREMFLILQDYNCQQFKNFLIRNRKIGQAGGS